MFIRNRNKRINKNNVDDEKTTNWNMNRFLEILIREISSNTAGWGVKKSLFHTQKKTLHAIYRCSNWWKGITWGFVLKLGGAVFSRSLSNKNQIIFIILNKRQNVFNRFDLFFQIKNITFFIQLLNLKSYYNTIYNIQYCLMAMIIRMW